MDNVRLQKEIVLLEQDHAALMIERSRVNALTQDITRAKEREEDLLEYKAETSVALKKAIADVKTLTTTRDEYKYKCEELEMTYDKTRIDLKEYRVREKLSTDINEELSRSYAKQREMWAEYEVTH